MKNIRTTLLLSLFGFLLAATALAADHGYVTSEPEDHPADHLFRVNIESVNGKESEAVNIRVPAGENQVKVSLVFNSSWGVSMQETQGRTYSKDLTLQVEKGKTYFLGAKVDTQASPEAQRDGSFWEPVVVETKGH